MNNVSDFSSATFGREHATSRRDQTTPANAHVQVGPPLWLLAELTYRCPLHCVFCSNPVDYAMYPRELGTGEWIGVMRDARSLGAAQLGFSGGEPLLREDLEVLVAEAHRLGFYTNLITSGIGLTERRLGDLKAAGLDHIQLSFQDSSRQLNDFLSSTRTFDLKKRVAATIKAHGFPMVMNCVLHRYNLPHVDKIIEMALEMGAEYLELANTQYYGWAYLNRVELMPTHAQVRQAEAVVERYREQAGDRCKILFVVPDYLEQRPKRCMNGWGNLFLGVSPDGLVMPCHAARSLPELDLPRVGDMSLEEAWYRSDAFNRFRGVEWMKEPCQSCDKKELDLGGCRCQAYLLTGDADNTDAVCAKSPLHGAVEQTVRFAALRRNDVSTGAQRLVFRTNANSREQSRAGTAND